MNLGTFRIKYKTILSGAKSSKTQTVVIKNVTITPIVKSPAAIKVSQHKDISAL